MVPNISEQGSIGVFGVLVVIILDWYHLRKKVRELIRELMSMIARNKSEKKEHLEFVFSHLWHGQTEEVLDYLKNNVEAKNEEKLQELVTYIGKHFEPIIDYDKRKKAGKEVGLKPKSEDETDDADVVQNQASSAYQAVKKVIVR